jgi:hypothetical protein
MFRAFLHKNQFPNSKFYYELAFMFLPQEIPAGQIILEGHMNAKDIYLIVNGEVYFFFLGKIGHCLYCKRGRVRT